MPVVKGFKISTKFGQNQNSANEPLKEYTKDVFKETPNGVPRPPGPPTMPVITGVTLKSVRPRSIHASSDGLKGRFIGIDSKLWRSREFEERKHFISPVFYSFCLQTALLLTRIYVRRLLKDAEVPSTSNCETGVNSL